MRREDETPGALAGATGGDMESVALLSPQYRLRREWATAAWFALDHCGPADQAHICATYLADLETDGPLIPVFGMIAAEDVRFWADTAPPHELAAYAIAALDRLARARLGIASRKRLLVALWDTLAPEDRQAFLVRVDPAGQFQRGAAA